MEWNMTHCTRSLLVKCHVSRVTLSKVNQTLRINKHNSITFRCNWLTELNPKLGSKLLPIYLFFKSLPQLQWKCRNVIETNSTPTIKVEKKWSYFNPNVLTLILWEISFCTISNLDSTLHWHWLDIWKLPWRKRSLNMELAYLFHFLRSPRV